MEKGGIKGNFTWQAVLKGFRYVNSNDKVLRIIRKEMETLVCMSAFNV